MSQNVKSTIVRIPFKQGSSFSERQSSINYSISMHYEKLRSGGMYPLGHKVTRSDGEGASIIIEYTETT